MDTLLRAKVNSKLTAYTSVHMKGDQSCLSYCDRRSSDYAPELGEVMPSTQCVVSFLDRCVDGHGIDFPQYKSDFKTRIQLNEIY